MGESVAALFLAGIVHGVMLGVGLMVMVRLMPDRYDLPKAERIVQRNQSISPVESVVSWALIRINIAGLLYAISGIVTQFFSDEVNGWLIFLISLPIAHAICVATKARVCHDFRIVCKKAIAPLQTPIIILGGILVGVFTPTEASAVAVAYVLIVSFFVLRSMKAGDLIELISKSALSTAAVLLLVGAAVSFKTVVSLSYAPQIMSKYILGLSENPLILLFLINILLFVVGMFLDAGPAISSSGRSLSTLACTRSTLRSSCPST